MEDVPGNASEENSGEPGATARADHHQVSAGVGRLGDDLARRISLAKDGHGLATSRI